MREGETANVQMPWRIGDRIHLDWVLVVCGLMYNDFWLEPLEHLRGLPFSGKGRSKAVSVSFMKKKKNLGEVAINTLIVV